MKPIEELEKADNLVIYGLLPAAAAQGLNTWEGYIEWPDFRATVIWGYDEGGMEHVSISSMKKKQLPSWEIMCRLKDMFFYPDEMAVQIHPPESEYLHGVGQGTSKLENVLHLWRPKDGDYSRLNQR